MIHPTDKGGSSPTTNNSTQYNDEQQLQHPLSAPSAAMTLPPRSASGSSTKSAPTSRSRRKKPKTQTPPTKDMTPLDPNFQPGRLDVICSRGKFAYNSPGNCWFRTMVEEQMDNYANARTKTDKSLVVSILVNRVRHANPEGGFVKNFGGRWYRVSDRYSREKVGQQFRDLLHTKYRSSTKAKAEKRKRQQEADLGQSNSSFDEETSGASKRDRVAHITSTSPKPSPASSANLTVCDDDDDVTKDEGCKLPALDRERRNSTPSFQAETACYNLKPRYGIPPKTVPGGESEMPPLVAKTTTADLTQHPFDDGDGTMDLEYLDDLEPLSMQLPAGLAGRRQSNANANMSFTFGGAAAAAGGAGLDDSFPNIFQNPPDMHQSLPPRSLEFLREGGPSRRGSMGSFAAAAPPIKRGSNSSSRGNNNSNSNGNNLQQEQEEGDPFHHPWHMSI